MIKNIFPEREKERERERERIYYTFLDIYIYNN